MPTLTVGKPFTVFVLAVRLPWLSSLPLWLKLSHIGRSNSKTALYYLKLADVIRAGAPADLLASAPSQSQEASRIYEDYNASKDFVSNSSSFKCALPPSFSLCLMVSSSFQLLF